MSNLNIDNLPDRIIVDPETKPYFTTLILTCVLDTSLSWKAKGIHTYFISRPPNWKIWYNDLLNKSTEGQAALDSGLAELLEKKYLYRFRRRDKEGRFTNIIWMVFSQPTDLSEDDIERIVAKNT